MTKIVTIGIDSATFDIIEPLVKEGKLPVIARLMKEGVWGRLKSTTPPVTPPAWTSFMTGKNPGKHGIFDFYGPPSFGYERPVVNSLSNRSKTLWRILSEKGKTVGVINVPMTYPPESVNGFLIPGMQYAFDVKKGFTFPDKLLSEIEEKFGEYEVMFGDDMSLYSDHMDNFISRWKKINKQRLNVILYLLDKYKPDFFMPTFYSIDLIQHHFWKYFDSTHPNYDAKLAKKYRHVIPEFYQEIDSYIGQIIKIAGDDATIFIVSDHGAGPQAGGFFLNEWLMQEKLLNIKRRHYPLVKIKWPHIVYKVLKRLGHRGIAWTIPMSHYFHLRKKVDPRDGLRLSEIIDWKKTKVYAGNHTEQGIYINLKGREVNGVVSRDEYDALRDTLADRLSSLVDPHTKEKLVDSVIKKEDVYQGPYTDNAADLFVEMKGGSMLMLKSMRNSMFQKKSHTSGTHRMDGIVLVKGDMIKAGSELKNPSIIDLAPTILYLCGLEIPEDMDGRVLKEIIKDDFLHRTPEKYGPPSAVEDGGAGLYDDKDAEKIKEMLRNLGYS